MFILQCWYKEMSCDTEGKIIRVTYPFNNRSLVWSLLLDLLTKSLMIGMKSRKNRKKNPVAMSRNQSCVQCW